MRSRVQHLGIIGEGATEDLQKIKRGVRNVMSHGAVQSIQTDSFLEIAVSNLMNRFGQQR